VFPQLSPFHRFSPVTSTINCLFILLSLHVLASIHTYDRQITTALRTYV
jgi:hypothetical protein